jgi:hypothetical protein
MLMASWLWALSSALAPAEHFASVSIQAIEAQCAAVDAIARPWMTLTWVEDDDLALF